MGHFQRGQFNVGELDNSAAETFLARGARQVEGGL